MIKATKKWISENILYIAWIIALTATVGSLIFSEVLKYPPCTLCWWQRIFMYPLVVILFIGILKKDKILHLHALPLLTLGTIFAIYHNLLQYGFIPESLAPCSFGVSCITNYFTFGFISIPLLSLLSFIAIGICILIYKKSSK